MNDNVSPSLQPFLTPIPFEVIGKTRKRATELDRDRAAIELAAYVIGILKFDASDICGHREELLRRANKVRVSQGNGAVAFVTETAEPDTGRGGRGFVMSRTITAHAIAVLARAPTTDLDEAAALIESYADTKASEAAIKVINETHERTMKVLGSIDGPLVRA